MPKESEIRKKVVQILENDGWIVWYPPKVRYKKTDIFGIIDLLALKGRRQKNIQLTTVSNLATRRKKIDNFLTKFEIEMTVEIWAWYAKKKEFKKEKVRFDLPKKPKKKKPKII
ncbi:MAG TPA: hypothetical protein P5570_00460 [Candidatus Paceibacterota bacterium]|jgi:EAL domain-containing protein (putative c-di-GMP-specific phosphodiesterase class I)|nr:hypothetical protein [Candidatus Pacearchaeota archaeon]HPZ74412.1 hypothetical protein [Candidatus Pacearchaeota archaeon]HQD89053.1 hypothetical protein [Candidatus Pacearchaeota archaeon]HRR39223.1 hypothetical protein [Candidatus Paceibacterota bacterium]